MNDFVYEIIKSDFGPDIVKRTNDNGDVAWIPTDPANSDYAQYLASLEATEPEAE